MKLTAKPFQDGYNEIVREDGDTGMLMDFGVLCLATGDVYECDYAKERVFVLMTGKINFSFDGKDETVERKSCFHEGSIVLHVPRHTTVKITGIADKSEIAIQATTNSKTFAPRLLHSEDCLTPSEVRGSGVMNDTALRICRTFFDRSNCPETNFFIGEVVMNPGKWSGFPTHTHMEPEIYYYKFLPENGYGFAEVGNDVYKVKNNDLTGMPHGLIHSQAAAPGYAEYFIWVIRLQDDVDIMTTTIAEHAWAAEPDAKFFPEI